MPKNLQLFQFFRNKQKVCEGVLKDHAYLISKTINENPDDSFKLLIFKALKTKNKIIKEYNNTVDITEYCLYSLL